MVASPPRTDTPRRLPVVDLEGRPEDDAARRRIAARLDDAFGEFGFCYLAGTGVDPAIVRQVFDASRAFHALDPETKQALAINAYHRGYIAPASSTLRSSSVAEVKRPNQSESIIMMNEVDPADPEFGFPLMGPNQWPDLPGFRETALAYMTAMRRLGESLNRIVSIALGLAPEHLDPCFAHPTTWLRLLHYPPQAPDAPADLFGAAPHTDYGYLTILAQDELGGLEVRDRSGAWIAAAPIPDTFVLNVGDVLARWTAGRWPSTPHRVKNLSGTDRYSVPFFYDPHLSTVLEPLPGLAAADEAPEAIVYRDYLLGRLDRNYSYRH